MLSPDSLYKYIAKYGMGKSTSAGDEIAFESYLGECRRALNDRTPKEYYQWEDIKQINFTENQIIQFVNTNPKPVEGYVSDGIVDVVRLIDELKKIIMDYGILEDALNDEDIQEIQINDAKSIWIVRKGRNELYVDKKGNPYQFLSDSELQATIYRMCYNPNGTSKRMTSEDPLMNTRAARSGFRISGVNNTAITPDKSPYDFPVTSITIRKYSSNRFVFDDYVRFNSLRPRMAKFLKCTAVSDTRMFFIGPTSSGKTTLLWTNLYEVPEETRTILIQNPTEILLYDRDINGTNRRNVLHWEADSIPESKNTETKPTMSNFTAHALRNTPDIIVPGEARLPNEFYEIYRAILTGHRVLGTFHSDTGRGALERFASEVAQATGGNKTEYLRSLCGFIDLIVSQYKLVDGTRKVMEISVPTGKVLSDGSPEIVKMFEFTLSRKNKKDEKTGKIIEVCGEFRQVGVLDVNGELAQKLFKAGYDYEELIEFFDEKYIGVV